MASEKTACLAATDSTVAGEQVVLCSQAEKCYFKSTMNYTDSGMDRTITICRKVDDKGVENE